MKKITFIFIGYLCCSILSYGITFAHFQGKYPTIAEEEYGEDKAFAIGMSIGGPLSLWASYFSSGFAKHGLKFK